MNPETTMKSSNGKKMVIGIIVLVLIVVGIMIFRTKGGTPSTEQQTAENNALIVSINKLMIVPEEQPVIATINQADVLVKEQAFYNGSQNGDKLVIFPKAQKAVIYSPSRNIIVNSGPFVINSNTTATPTTNTPAVQTPAKK